MPLAVALIHYQKAPSHIKHAQALKDQGIEDVYLDILDKM